jgi:hypothetical protein
VPVAFNASGHTDSVIHTKELGPCIGFIWSFNLDEKSTSILDHYSFSDDESKSTVECTVIFLLNRFLFLLAKPFEVASLFNEKNICRINNIHLIATGGDYIEGLYYRQVCVSLYTNDICLNQFINDKEILYFYTQLKHRVITLNPVTKCLSSKTIRKV